MNNKEIIELYDLYGFSLEKELEDAVIFSYSNGYFNNIEIKVYIHFLIIIEI